VKREERKREREREALSEREESTKKGTNISSSFSIFYISTHYNKQTSPHQKTFTSSLKPNPIHSFFFFFHFLSLQRTSPEL
jgi:hypothetical protein